ncbi:nuclear transport factor 2 family protein [Qipengyuania atrilutea]|uniref:Nuclear transport factor 2 family protein n=1 Tax=Qipengyuania atrilutea TaxID=2744473 RepID=A0A850H9E3_9SPHN|nr:nuclear transport factor 2 family protein [Actirhodobacter atriluteus]NVD45925.1 nuclear transport factor 2 family protein [Actirhodobacter atriluteus]
MSSPISIPLPGRPVVFAIFLALAPAAPAVAQDLPVIAQADEAKIRERLHDYIDGQLEGNAPRVARALHPDLAKRAALPGTERESFPLRRMTADELIALTVRGELKQPRRLWDRTVTLVYHDNEVAIARIDTPWFSDHLQLARFGKDWLIVNALWVPKRARKDTQ